jgi:selenocysteine lyase/cysteine desulfurase
MRPATSLRPHTRAADVSPAWFCWVGTTPALELIEEIGVPAIHDHDVALANRFRAGLGMEAADSAIVSADVPDAAARLERAGIVAAMRGGRLRTSWHLYNDERDVDRVLEVVLG